MGTVSFLSSFIELKGTEIIMFKTLCILALLGLAQANEMKMVKKWAKKIAQHHFMTSCVGEKTMMKMWEKVEKTANECLQLEPAFDIPLFEGDDGDDMDVNPFITSNKDSKPYHPKSTLWPLDSGLNNLNNSLPIPGTGCTIHTNNSKTEDMLLHTDTNALSRLQPPRNSKSSREKWPKLKK